MANDTIKFKFDVEGSGAVDGAMKEKRRLLDEIDAAAKRAGASLPKAQFEQFSRLGVDALKQIAQQFGATENKITSTTSAVNRLNDSLRQTAIAGRQAFADRPQLFNGQAALAGGFNGPASGESTRGGGGAGGNLSLLGGFNRAAKSQLDIAGAAKGVGDLNDKLGKVPGVTYIGAQALHLFGIQGGRAISIVTRQASEMGTTLEQVFQNPTLGFITLIAGAVLFAKEIFNISQSFSEMEKAGLQSQKSLAFLTQEGLVGNVSEKTEALKKFIAAQREFKDLTDPSQLVSGLGRALGGRGTEDEINAARVELSEARRKRFFLGIEAFGEDAGDFAPKFLTKGNTDKINEAQEKLAKLRGGIVTLDLLDARVKQTIKGIDAVEIRLFDAGTRDNIFDKAARSLRVLAKEANSQREVKDFIDNALLKARGGTLNPDQFNDQVANLQENLQKRAEQERLRKASQDAANALVASRAKESKSAQRQTVTLSDRLEDNPLARLFSEAQERMFRFKEQFPLVTQDVIAQFAKVNQSVLDLDIFKQSFSDRIGLRKLSGDVVRLQSAGSFSDHDISEIERSRVADAKLREARQFGSLDDLRIAQAAIFGRGSELEAQARNAHFNGQFVQEAEFRNQADQFNRGEKTRLTERDIRETEIKTLKGELGKANGPERQILILDKLLETTSNLGELRSDDRETRLKALQQRLALGEVRQKVLIQIQNDAGDSAKITQDSLGPEPTPDLGNGFFGRGFGQQGSGAQQ